MRHSWTVVCWVGAWALGSLAANPAASSAMPVVRLSALAGLSEAEARGVGVDREGNIYIAGFTSSPHLPAAETYFDTTLDGPSDIFVVKLDPAGKTVRYATFIGGSGNDSCKAMAVAPDGSVYLTGSTKSSDFPITPGGLLHPGATYDVFVTKLNPEGTGLAYSCRFGGSAMEEARGITVDAEGHCIVVGGTHSPEFPVTEGAYQTAYKDPPEATPDVAGSFVNGEDAFIAKINPEGTGFVFCTYLGGRGFEKAWATAVDPSGNIYVAGHAEALDFPLGAAPQQRHHGGGMTRERGEQYGAKDAFLAKLSADGRRLLAATYFGGSGQDVGYGVGVDRFGNVYLGGNTNSADLPLRGPANPQFGGGKSDIFVASFDSALSTLRFATYLGGADNDEMASDAFAVDDLGHASVAGVTASADFPATAGAIAGESLGGGTDAFVVRLTPEGATNYATRLGGSAADKSGSLALDADGNVYVSGVTRSRDFRLERADASNADANGGAFVVRVDAD